MRCVEVVPLRLCNTNQVISFLQNQIITRFGTLEYLVFDNASYFQSIDLTSYALERVSSLSFMLITILREMHLQNPQTKT